MHAVVMEQKLPPLQVVLLSTLFWIITCCLPGATTVLGTNIARDVVNMGLSAAQADRILAHVHYALDQAGVSGELRQSILPASFTSGRQLRYQADALVDKLFPESFRVTPHAVMYRDVHPLFDNGVVHVRALAGAVVQLCCDPSIAYVCKHSQCTCPFFAL